MVSWVREFYASMSNGELELALVKEKIIKFTLADIDRVYGLTCINNPKGNEIMLTPSEELMKETIKKIARKEVQWEYMPTGMRRLKPEDIRSEPAI